MTKEKTTPNLSQLKDQIFDSLNERIKICRELGLSQKDIATYLGVTQPRLSNAINYHTPGIRETFSLEWGMEKLMMISPGSIRIDLFPEIGISREITKLAIDKKAKKVKKK